MRRGLTKTEILVVIFIVFIVLCLGGFVVIEFLLHFFLGWILFLGRSIQRVTFSPSAVATAVVCGLGFVFGLHWFLKQKVIAIEAFNWRFRYTAIASAGVALLFIAGVSIVSVTHQTSWLVTSPGPWTQGTSVRDAARRTHSRNMLTQIGMGGHYYHDAYGILTVGGSFDSQGQGLHSWETFLLPYVDQTKLYEEIDLTKPWTDVVHRTAFQKGMNAFRNPKHPESQKNIHHNHSHYAMNARVAGVNQSLSLIEFKDGTTNTLLTGEVKHAPRAWGDPVNFRDPAIGFESPNGFGSVWSGGYVQFTFADGTTRAINPDIDPEILKALSTPSGGEAIDDF